MSAPGEGLLSEVERVLQGRYGKEGEEKPTSTDVPSTARRSERATRVDQLLLPMEKRAKMPLTKEQYLVRENPQQVLWERETRNFLRQLTPLHEHRVAAVMIYEWATGLPIQEHMRLERERGGKERGTTSWRADLIKINKVLEFYFGKPYMTYIANRKIPKAYKVKQGYYVNRHRPMTLTLWVDYRAGLKP